MIPAKEDFIFQGEKPNRGKPISLVILTTKLESSENSYAPTVKKIMAKSSAMNFKCVVINTSQGEIEKTETGSFYVRNKGSQKKYEIDTKAL